MTTAQDLIERGFFPTELVPAFTTSAFSRVLSHITSVRGAQASSKYCVHSIPRLRHARRTLGVPHPLNQYKLCRIVEQNWTALSTHMARSPISLSTPVSDTTRAVKTTHDWSEVTFNRATCAVGSRFVLKTDMSRYYSTIYTHSIPWALHTKPIAKSNTTMSLFGNQIDRDIRNCQDKQTIGIPIGPDTSLIISECICTAIDDELSQQMNVPLKGIRYIDDYYLYFESYADAENALALLRVIAKNYELELNSSKTDIIPIPETFEQEWVSALRFHTFRTSVRGQLTDILSYFSRAFEYAKVYRDQTVLKYALSRIKTLDVDAGNWSVYESLILKCIMAEPSVFQVATETLLAYMQRGFPVNVANVSSVIDETILYHTKFNHGYELAWALWLCKTLHITLSAAATHEISLADDPFVILVALDLENSGLTSGPLNRANWNQYMNAAGLYGEHWVLAYEALRRGWLNSTNNYITSDPFFSVLDTRNVSFYDPMLQVTPPTLSSSVPKIAYGGGAGGGY